MVTIAKSVTGNKDRKVAKSKMA